MASRDLCFSLSVRVYRFHFTNLLFALAGLRTVVQNRNIVQTLDVSALPTLLAAVLLPITLWIKIRSTAITGSCFRLPPYQSIHASRASLGA